MSRSRAAVVAAALLLAGGLRTAGQNPASGRATLPETAEILKAERIADPEIRLKELLRIRSAYPGTIQAARLESGIIEARIDLAETADAVVALQKAFVGQGRGTARMTSFAQAAARILDHPRRAAFDPGRVLAAVLDYRARAEKAASDPETFASTPDPEDRRLFTVRVFRDFSLLMARALAGAGEGEKAIAALDEYRAGGGEAGPEYFEACGDACSALGRIREAFGFYLSAAVANRPGTAAKAREAYVGLHGHDRGFEERLERLQSALPFRPKPFAPPKHWRGKTVLIEVFTNTENPLCLATDLAAAGLIQSYPGQYLAVLEYHLSLPRFDPLANAAALSRRDRYRITGTPAAVVDGGIRLSGGGTRSMAEARFEQLKSQIDGWLPEEPDLRLKVRAVRAGDKVEAETSFNRERPGAEHYVALVQDRERLKGASGTIIHRHIVRALVRLGPGTEKTVVFDLAGIEKEAEAFLAQGGESAAAGNGEAAPASRPEIDRKGLKIVYFVQDMGSRRILNAVVAEVESP